MNTSRRKSGVMFLTVTAMMVLAAAAVAAYGRAQQQQPAEAAKAELKPQSTCPIMGEKINKSVFVDAAGYRIYACCSGCLEKIKADPEKAVATLESRGETPEVRLVVCPECGEIKGSKACRNPDAPKCEKCGLHKGSIGCCRDLKPQKGEKDVVLCPMCGEVKGSKACCRPDATKCSVCGMIKGSPGCCKLETPAKGKKQ